MLRCTAKDFAATMHTICSCFPGPIGWTGDTGATGLAGATGSTGAETVFVQSAKGRRRRRRQATQCAGKLIQVNQYR